MIRLKKLLTAAGCLLLVSSASAQTIQERTVEDRKVFICNMSDRDTFKTAEEGCKHWAQKHAPGYTYKSSTVAENGAVRCICTKAGSSDNDQQGQIMGIIICPENASASPENQTKNYKDWTCLCYQGYIADGKICKKDPCSYYSNMSEDGLKGWATSMLQKFCDEENAAFVAAPSDKMYPQGEPPIFTDSEIFGFMQMAGGAGMKKIAGTKNKYTYADWVWPIVYGHAIERLVARRVEKDECLKKFVSYVNNANQTKEEDANPDFKGQSKLPAGVHFDVTTTGQVAKKKNNPAKAHFIFITYTRGLDIDKYGNPMPPGQTGPPPPSNKPPKITIPKPPTNTNPKPPSNKPPKSSTDGR